jgi:hypothetical protein
LENPSDVPEAAFNNIQILFVRDSFEHRLWRILKELGKWKEVLDLVHIARLEGEEIFRYDKMVLPTIYGLMRTSFAERGRRKPDKTYIHLLETFPALSGCTFTANENEAPSVDTE